MPATGLTPFALKNNNKKEEVTVRVIKKLNAGVPGTKFYEKQYGKNLLCVRHRHNTETDELLTTVELIVQRRLPKGKYHVYSNRDHGAPIEVKIAFHETDLRRLVKDAGGQWINENKAWRLPYSEAIKLGLANRILTPKE